jgi:dTDP-4-amino-4,6-dideoxygalactose transaminase
MKYGELLTAAKPAIEVLPPFVREEAIHIFHQYCIRVPRYHDELMDHLEQNGVAVRVYYPVPLHIQECFSPLGYRAGDFPESERAAHETIALPCFPELTDEQQAYVVGVIASFRP